MRAMPAAISRPGTTPERNSLEIDCSAITPQITAAIDGGRRVAGGWSIAIALLGILLSFSRSALLCALAGVAAYAVLRQDRPRLRGGVPLFGAALIAALGAVASLSLERSEADLQRLRILRTSLVLFSEHWPLGVGFGIENLRRVFPARYIELYGSSLFLFHSHNMYVEFLVGTGVLVNRPFAYVDPRVAATDLWVLGGSAHAVSRPDHLLVLGPVRALSNGLDSDRNSTLSQRTEQQPAVVAVIELWLRGDSSPATQRGCEQYLAAVCELAADYHAFHELRERREAEQHRTELLELGPLVHNELSLSATAYAVANEGRRVVDCDRLSVLEQGERNAFGWHRHDFV